MIDSEPISAFAFYKQYNTESNTNTNNKRKKGNNNKYNKKKKVETEKRVKENVGKQHESKKQNKRENIQKENKNHKIVTKSNKTSISIALENNIETVANANNENVQKENKNHKTVKKNNKASISTALENNIETIANANNENVQKENKNHKTVKKNNKASISTALENNIETIANANNENVQKENKNHKTVKKDNKTSISTTLENNIETIANGNNENLQKENKNHKTVEKSNKTSISTAVENNIDTVANSNNEIQKNKPVIKEQNKKPLKGKKEKRATLKLMKHDKKPKRQKSTSGYFHVDNADSRKSGEQLFSWIINPLPVEQFFKDNWEKKPIIIQRKTPTYYSHILSCTDIDAVLRKKCVYFTKNIDITSYDAQTGVRQTHNPSGRATAPLVWDFYSNGCSVRMLNPQTFFPKVHALNASLQEYFGCFVGANIYLTPADSQGFAPHYDDIEAFVIQLEGEKLWRLYAPRSESEVLPRYSSGNFTDADLGPPIQEVLLKAGDMMYFPRGIIHQGVALGNKHSLHITLSVYQKNSWADLIETLLPAALKCAIEEDVSFREGLPLHYLSHLGLVHSDQESPEREEFLARLGTLMSRLAIYAPVDAAVDQLGKRFVHAALPPALRPHERRTTVVGDGERIRNGEVKNQAEMCLASRVKLVRYHCIRMLREEDNIRIYHSVSNSKQYLEEDAQFLEIDEDLAPAVDYLINRYPEYVSVEDLPIEDDIAKVQLASDLWENGILKTEEPLSYESD